MNYAQGLNPCTITDMPSNGARRKTKRGNAKRKVNEMNKTTTTMNEKYKRLFDELVVEQYAEQSYRVVVKGNSIRTRLAPSVPVSLEMYRELCERKDKINQSFGGTGRIARESQESYRERSEKRIALVDAFYKELKEKNICMDWVNAPMDILSDFQFESMYASTWEGRAV